MISRSHKVVCNELAQLGEAARGNRVVWIKSLSDKSTKLSSLLPSRRERVNAIVTVAIVVVFVYITYGTTV